ncbi:unnamed protein product [Thlaspi arvense]|uniref:Transcription elongation factor TFIIS/CRSP70 N-terminal sub-type domain-containing protein n=1 Tax=Thlaspi arvense TaxID=13288 RepID=A0AAU9SJ86_THLAR|nr:unnamed protein product [Thlaspi arvense]
MQKHEFLELFKEATRAAKSAKGVENSPAVSRCVDAMDRLFKAPESLGCDLIIKTSFIGLSHKVFVEHINPKIRSEANLLYSLWLLYLYATGRKESRRECDRNRPPVVKKFVEMEISSGDSKRNKVHEILQKSLSRVASEVVETEMKKLVASCDPCAVTVSFESAMFENLGCGGPVSLAAEDEPTYGTIARASRFACSIGPSPSKGSGK